MRELENKVDANVLRDLQDGLSVFDEKIDFVIAVEGLRQQLQQVYSHRKLSILLAQISEKPTSALTEDDKALLRKFRH
jgi:DNA primase